MSEQQTVPVPDVKQDTASTASEEKQSVKEVPYARFSELVDEKNTLKVELDSLRKEAKQQSENRKLKEMESKGEYDKIMANMTSKLEVAETKAKAFDTYQASRRESLLSKLPEDDRAIYDGLPLEKLEVHVSKVNTKPSPASVDNSKPSSMGGYSSFAEWAALDPKGYEKSNNTLAGTGVKIAFE